jgi:hypothetical protein
MKKIACAILILTMAIFLISPLSSEARGGHRGGHSGWWVPWAVLGGAAVLAPYYYAPFYSPPPVIIQEQPVIIREQPPEYFQPAPSITPSTPSSTERIFVYPRQSQSEELQARDRYECHSWAVSQTSYDPTQPTTSGMPEARRNQMRADYQRAQGACLDARGYTMK